MAREQFSDHGNNPSQILIHLRRRPADPGLRSSPWSNIGCSWPASDDGPALGRRGWHCDRRLPPHDAEEHADLVRPLVGAIQEGAFQGTCKEAACMICQLDHDLPVRMGLWVRGAFVASCVLTVGALAYFTSGPFRPDVEAGRVWHELVQNNPDLRPALTVGKVRTDRITGRRHYVSVSLWLDPSRPPPVTPPKAQGGQ